MCRGVRRTGNGVTSEAHLDEAGALLRALSAPIRLALVEQLAAGPRCVHELISAIGASQSLVSQHLRVLRGARLVTPTRRGREIVYSLTDAHVAHIVRDAIVHAEEQSA
jgi:DNA-binding transcriptional ArsR family regulator